MAQYELLKDSCVGAQQMVSRRRLKRGELSLCYPNKHRLSNVMEMQKDKSMTRGGQGKDACKKKREQHDASQAPVGMNYPGAYGVAPPVWQIPFMGAKPVIPEVLAVPNNILFVQNLPLEATPLMLSVLFRQYPGFKAVCMAEAKSGSAFVEYENELLSTFAMNATKFQDSWR